MPSLTLAYDSVGGSIPGGFCPSRPGHGSGPLLTVPRGASEGEHQIGWIAAIIVGGLAGWLAEQFMKSEMGLVMNIVLG